MRGRFVRLYGRLRLRAKVFLSYALLLLALVMSLGFAALWQMSDLVNDKFLSTVSGSLRQLATHVSYRMQIVGNSTEMLSWDNDLRRILAYDRDEYSLASQIDDIQIARDIVLSVKLNEDVSGVRLYLRNPGLLSQERETFFPIQDIEHLPWADAAERSGGRAVWIGAEADPRATDSASTFVRCIRATDGSGDCLGILAVDIDPDVMGSVLRQSGLLEEAAALILIGTGGEEIATVGVPPAVPVDERAFVVLRQRLSFPGWTLRAYLSRATIQRERRQLVVSFVGILFMAAVLAFLLTLSISRRITERITGLTRVVSDPLRNAHQDNYDDEISELQRFLVGLVEKNRQLVHEVYEEKMAEKEAKLRALQTQINPHFLYNTLDTINWMALRKQEHEISTLVSQLARYYRLSIGQTTDIVTIREEIEHVRAFLGIYQTRYEGSIRTEYDISADALQFKTVRLILQPLAENAVIHGISKTTSQSGLVTIRAHAVDDAIEIHVADDGVGMSEKQYRRTLADVNAGFALKNVDERIRLFCGPEYGLRFDFSVPQGTCAIVRLAKTRMSP